MSPSPRMVSILVGGGLLLGGAYLAWQQLGASNNSARQEKPAPAANVPKIIKEEEFNTITLSAEAEKRLGLTIAAVEKKQSQRQRVYGGEVVIPVGQTFPVAAPLAGTLQTNAKLPRVGETIAKGTVVVQLQPLLTPDSRVTLITALADVEGQINNATTQRDNARIFLERAKRVLQEGAGSQRQVDEAQANVDQAVRLLEAANLRKTALTKVLNSADQQTTISIDIVAPATGVLRTVAVAHGQTVPAGAALFELVDLSTLWLRVPIPVGDWDAIAKSDTAFAHSLTGLTSANATSIQPVSAPPTANPLSATVDLYYSLPNQAARYIPGQRLGVQVPLRGSGECLGVPWSAVVFDSYGGTWVYEQVSPRQYVRQRVAIEHTEGTMAVLERGLRVGAKIVTAGAQELLGAETGFIK